MKLSHFFTVIALTAGATSLQAQTPINTVPEGIATFNLPATQAGAQSSSYFSAPLTNDPVYTGALSIAPTSNVITVGDNPPPWTTPIGGTATPYFVKFTSGLQAGRVLQVQGNPSSSSLTLDISDNTSQTVALNAANYSVAMGDTFEVFAGDTLALMFGSNTSGSPLVLKGGTSALNADLVSIYVPAKNGLNAYFFNTSTGHWQQVGNTATADNTVMRPYSGFLITRGSLSAEAATSFVLTGRVAEVNHLIKTTGNSSASYDSTGYPVDVKLSQLKLGANWAKAAVTANPSALFADTISIFNTASNGFDVYFELTDGTWRKVGTGNTDQSSFVIPAATTVVFTKLNAASGTNSFLQPVLPYSLTN